MPYKDRETQLKAQREHYQRNKDKYKRQLNERRRANRQKLLGLKSKLQCEVCGEAHPSCLEFHHTDPKEKDSHVSYGVHFWGWDRVLAEVKKCQVLCSNCHRKWHWDNEPDKYQMRL